MMFAFHSGLQLLLVTPEAGGPAGFKISDLKRMGWKVDAVELQRALPRVDPSAIEIAPAQSLRGLRR